MAKWTYSVEDSYNCFGAGHNWVLSLYRNNKIKQSWHYDSLFGSFLLNRKIRSIKKIYGAERA